jgi:predicted nucleic acid-binding protein
VRIVLDTNVLVSGLLSPLGPPGRIVDLVVAERVTVLFDDRIISDAPFLEVAVAAAADALVTGNGRHYRPVRGEHSARVRTPAAFLAEYTRLHPQG